MRADGNIYRPFKPNNYGDVEKLYQDKGSMDMILNEYKLLTSTCWNEKHQPLTIDMTEDNLTGPHRSGLISLFVPDGSPFYVN